MKASKILIKGFEGSFYHKFVILTLLELTRTFKLGTLL